VDFSFICTFEKKYIMSKVIAFTGSNSSTSINDQLLQYTLNSLVKVNVDYIDLKAMSIPVFSEDIEKSSGIPDDIKSLKAEIDAASAIIVAVSEHNGTMSSFFKNITDWLSRTDPKYMKDKKILLMGTSPGQGGAKFCLDYTKGNFEKFGGIIVDNFSLPSFQNNFSESGLSEDYAQNLKDLVSNFENDLNPA
jgi:NAD(P)H-dependent FMN reductase